MTQRTFLPTTLLALTCAAIATPAAACPRSGQHCATAQPMYYAAPQPIRYSTSRTVVPVTQVPQGMVARQNAKPASEATSAAELRTRVAQAKVAFAARNYGTALELMDRVVETAPRNSDVLQFRSLIRFALGEYKSAAADAYEALKHGPVWNSSAVGALYRDRASHERHVQALRDAAADRPDVLELRFLLAYQLLMTGDLDGGQRELEAALRIRPNEPLTARLLQVVRSASDTQTASTAP